MQNWLLGNLSDVLNQDLESDVASYSAPTCSDATIKQSEYTYHSDEKNRLAELKAQREWRAAISAVEKLLLSQIQANNLAPDKQGLIFSAPGPILSNIALIPRFQAGVFTPDAFNCMALMPCQESNTDLVEIQADTDSVIKLPLIPKDPIAQEQFGLVLTADFGLVMVLGQDKQGLPKFHFSFAPQTIEKVWATLRSRLILINYRQLKQLDKLLKKFAPPVPDYRLVTNFSRQLLQNLPDSTTVALPKTRQIETIPTSSASNNAEFTSTFAKSGCNSQVEMELLQALTHEIRTPLTTIRTLTKLLLKRPADFKPNVVKRIQAIDRECSEQIERMELIFQAAELESTTPTEKPLHLVSFPLEQVFQENIPRWQEKAQRRNVELDFSLPSKSPKILSDPVMLDKALTGLMESCTRSLPIGGQVHVKVSTAGDRLKLQVLSEQSQTNNPLKSLGQLLAFQPETGCLTLNLEVTKNIFQALGGKLTVRERQKKGKQLTVFLPLGNALTPDAGLNEGSLSGRG